MSEPTDHESITVEDAPASDIPPVSNDPAIADPDHADPHPVDEPLPPVEQMPDAQTAVPDPLPSSDVPPGDPVSLLPHGATVVEG